MSHILSDTIANCPKLETIIIKNIVISMTTYFDVNCPSLKDLFFAGIIDEWNNISFYGEWENDFLERINVVHCDDGDYPLTNN